jgi:1-acyl-sn-glycerol-3-phosphate acyltransferase
MDFWYNFGKSVAWSYIQLFVHDIHVEGRENLVRGPKIIVANHALATDAFVLPFVFPDRLNFMVQAEMFRLPILGKILAWADQIPVVRGKGQEALAAAKERLLKGNAVVIFPEGRLNDGNEFHRAFTGATRLTLESGAPVVPVGFYTPPKFARLMSPKMFGRQTHGAWQFGGETFLKIGEAWRPAIESSAENSYSALRELTDDLMGHIRLQVDQAKAFATGIFLKK